MTLNQPQITDSTEAPWPGKARTMRALFAPHQLGGRLNIAIALAMGMSLVYFAGLLIDQTKPPLPRDPAGLFILVPIPFPAIWHMSEVVIFVGWSIAAIVGVFGLALTRIGSGQNAGVRACQITVLAALLLPYATLPVAAVVENQAFALLCLPTTAFGLWLVRRMQPFRKFPVWLLLLGSGWGALIAAGFSIAMTSRFAHYAPNVFLDFDFSDLNAAIQSFNDLNGLQERLFTSAALNSGLSGELAKIVGIALLFMFYRRYFDDIVSGIAIGAAVGLGTNFVESIQFMAASGITWYKVGGPATQYWSHQVLGLMASHVAFGALAGAGFGVARQLQDAKQRWVAVLCGCGAAMAAHFASDVIRVQFLLPRVRWARENPWFETLVAEPLLLAVTTGPFVVLYLVLLARGTRHQAAGLSIQAQAEASSGTGAITPTEIPTVRSFAARFFIRVDTLRNNSFSAYRRIRDLQAAQLDLVTSRWHRARRETDPESPAETLYRDRTLILKRQIAAATASTTHASEATL